MSEARKTPQHDPTAERTADQSTQGAGGLHQGVDAVERSRRPEVAREAEDTAYRNDEDLYETPRRYDAEDGEDPVMPSNDSSLNTKL